MDKLLRTYNLPGLNHEEPGSLNRSVSNKKIKSVMKYIPTEKSPEPHGCIN